MKKEKILLIGSGGRECALAWKMADSKKCESLFIAPGNAGTAAYGQNVAIDVLDFSAMKALVLREGISLVIVGPEAPLVSGIYDFFKGDEELKHVMIVGPSKESAQLEGSKAFAKEFMAENKIPTADYGEYTLATIDDGLSRIDQTQGPYVLKADGLAAGKGVLIIADKEEAKKELRAMLEGKFGEASKKVVIEAFLDGIEFSVFVVTDGKDYVVLPEAKDYKRIGENDKGLNTGGMGAVSPVPFYTPEVADMVRTRIIEPTINGLQNRKMEYRGFIFLGLIMVDNEPFVIEYNCRMGDPESEVVIPRLESDLVELMTMVGSQKLSGHSLKFKPEVATTIMLVSGGYPEAYEKGKVISKISEIEHSIVFHAGTTINEEGSVVTAGGRVLAITTLADNMEDALKQSLRNAEIIDFQGKYYRRDIGFDL